MNGKPKMSIQEAIQQLKAGRNLTQREAGAVMQALLSGSVADETIASLLAALRDKGETADELAGFAEVMRARAAEDLAKEGVDARRLSAAGLLLDTCGTGGDGLGTFNVSTAAALVAAAAGARVAKHGNRSISSRCGSADVLEALGVVINLPVRHIPECLEKAGIVFLFAPHVHTAMRHVMAARRALKTKTVFNLLGPLTNPLGAAMQLTGVYDLSRTEMMAQVLATAGASRAFVVSSYDGMDEISISAPTRLSETDHGAISTRDVEPGEFGLPEAAAPASPGGDVEINATILRRVLQGETGPHHNMVLANASAALVVAGLAADWLEGVELASAAIQSGAALKTLSTLVDFTREHAA